MEIPITQLINVATVFVLVFVMIRLWKRSFQQGTIPLFLFASAFSAILLMMSMFALPLIAVRDSTLLQIAFSIADLMLMIAIGLFTAVAISLIFPTNRALLIILPGLIGLIGLSIFLWQISNPILPTFPVPFFTWGEITFINYTDGSPIFLKIIQGIIATCVFLIGSFLFFWQARNMKGIIHARAFLLGLGYATATVAVIANYIVGAYLAFQTIFFFIASSAALLSVVFMYKGICVKIPNPLDRKTKNMYK